MWCSQKQKLQIRNNVLLREFQMKIDEDLKEDLMADVPEELIEDFIENLMEDFDGG